MAMVFASPGSGQAVDPLRAVGVEDQMVYQAEFEALEDDFGSDGAYG